MDGIDTVAILCGGRGTRLREKTESMPKALVEIGGRPILWHVMQIYAAQGCRRFVLCTGYLGEQVKKFAGAETWPAGVEGRCVDTGLDTPTGGRLKLAGEAIGPGSFFATYADGVADIDLGALDEFHAGHGELATMTIVRPNLQFGVAELDGYTRVKGFVEKPEKPTRVGVLMDVADMDAVMAAMETEEAAEAMAFDGVLPETLVILVER